MTVTADEDNALAARYAETGSEDSFKGLVQRHVNLVFATALRQVGDRGLAEEITQNVFLALAKKASGLRGHCTIAGWLHRTTILEAKARVRAELRRKQREEISAQLTLAGNDGESPLEPLLPLLDEGLLSLRDQDRVALVLRYIEERSLRDVGSSLGVDEDAARKRVNRALDRLADFFRSRGIAVPGGATALLAAAATPAPPALAATIAQAAASSALKATILSAVMLQIMTISKTKLAVACAVAALIPIGLQHRAIQQSTATQANIADQIRIQRERLASLDAELASMGQRRAQTTAATLNTVAAVEAFQNADAAAPAEYKWDDASPLMRVPKRILLSVNVPTVRNRNGMLSEEIKVALQITEQEATVVEGGLQHLLAAHFSEMQRVMQVVEPTQRELGGAPADHVRAFAVPDLTEKFTELRQQYFAEVENTLGPDRSKMFIHGLRELIPLQDQKNELHSSRVLMLGDHRIIFRRPTPGEQSVGWGVNLPSGSAMFATIQVDQIPQIFHAHLHDWMDLATRRDVVVESTDAQPRP